MSCNITPIECPPGHDFPPCENVEVSYIFDPNDFHVKINDGRIVELKPKRRGTYHGKIYDRSILILPK